MSYITIIVAIFLILWVMEEYLTSVVEFITKWALKCPDAAGGGAVCLGVSAVYRFSAALAILHLAILFFCTFRNKMAKEINEGCWICKVLIVIAIWVGLLWIPNEYFKYYVEFAKYIGGLFLLF